MSYEEIKKLDYCINKDYPKIEKNIKNDRLAKKLLDIYAGTKGEITATCQYMYESFITNYKNANEELSNILEKISICEMKHVELIAKILQSMDIDPKFCKYIDNNYNICNYWTAGNVKYITNVDKFLEYNIKLEEIAIEDYKEALKLTDSQNIIDVINAIIEDEKAHIIVFKKLKDDYINKLNLRCIENEKISNNENKQQETIIIKNKQNNNNNLINVLSVSKADFKQSNNIKKEDKSIRIPILDLSILTSKDNNDEISDG